MEHESFEKDDIAAILNEHFVSIKVDREERPDLDQIYMSAVQLLNNGQGGWPMSVFLTPDLRPFSGGTYFPPEDRYGRPGFKRVLLTLAGWRWSSRHRSDAHGFSVRNESGPASTRQPSTCSVRKTPPKRGLDS